MRSLELLLASSLVVFAVGCGDASDPSVGDPAPSANVGQDPATAASPAASAPSSAEAPSGPAPTPSNPPTGNVYFRVANFLPNAADACVSPDSGATWVGPIMHELAGKPADPSTVTARLSVPNAHFMARLVTGADCTKGVGTDVKVTDIIGEWPATIVLGQSSGAPELRVLADEPSLSMTSTFFRFIQAANWSTNADMGLIVTDCCGNNNYGAVFVNTPFLGVALAGSLSAQGYAAIDPLGAEPMVFQTTTTGDIRATITATTDVNEKYTIFTMGTDATTSLLFCDDAADPTPDSLTPCTALNDGDTFQDTGSQDNSGN